jgi:hypothetical protein
MANKTILENVKDAIAAGAAIVESAKNEIVWVLPPQALVLAAQYGLSEKSKILIEEGGHVRGITDISSPYISVVRQLLDIGEEVRHLDRYQGEFMLVADQRDSLSSLAQQTADLRDLALDDRIAAFWTDDPSYAEYLVTTFETVWKDAVDAKKQIEQLLEQDRPQA